MPQSIFLPPGSPPPNYVNPPRRPPGIQIVSSIFIVLITVSLALRLYTRMRISMNLGIDDVFAIIATVCS